MASLKAASAVLEKLIKGSRIRALVVEVQADQGMLVNYRGSLFLVRNESGRHFQKNDELSLQVVGLNPIELKIFDAEAGFDRFI